MAGIKLTDKCNEITTNFMISNNVTVDRFEKTELVDNLFCNLSFASSVLAYKCICSFMFFTTYSSIKYVKKSSSEEDLSKLQHLAAMIPV